MIPVTLRIRGNGATTSGMGETMRAMVTPIDLFSAESLNVVGPIGTVLAMIGFIYWGLARNKLVTGAQHLRELAVLNRVIEREQQEHDATEKQMREDHAKQIADVRADAVASAARRELENAATIAGLREDVHRMFLAWQVTEGSANRAMEARISASDETIMTFMEAIRRSPLAERLPPEIAEPTVGGNDGR